MYQDSKNVGNVAGGHKAALKNPNVSEEAKEHSQQVLEELEDQREPQARPNASESRPEDGKNFGNFIGGHKATLNNPRVSEEAKEHSREILEEREAI